MERRKALLNDFKLSSPDRTGIHYSELCFRILYGLPANLQIGLATFSMQRYLPFFEAKWPTVKWPREILNNVAQWVFLHDRCIPDEPSGLDAADAAFSFSFDGLLLAYTHPRNNLTLTASAACAIHSAINAHRLNGWITNDPQAYQMWKRRVYIPGRRSTDNPAAVAVAEREWNQVTDWLRQEEVWTYPDEVVRVKMEQDLARWKRREMLLIVPGINLEPFGNQYSELKMAA